MSGRDSCAVRQFFNSFPEMPGDAGGEPAFYRAARDLADRGQRQAGALLPYMSSLNTARPARHCPIDHKPFDPA